MHRMHYCYYILKYSYFTKKKKKFLFISALLYTFFFSFYVAYTNRGQLYFSIDFDFDEYASISFIFYLCKS